MVLLLVRFCGCGIVGHSLAGLEKHWAELLLGLVVAWHYWSSLQELGACDLGISRDVVQAVLG